MISAALWEPSPGEKNARFIQRIRELNLPSATSAKVLPALQLDIPLPEALFDSVARSARLVAMLSMHLSSEWRGEILSQLGKLLSFDDWDDDCNLLDEESTRSFLRFVIYGNVQRIPALGISNRKFMTATWIWADRRAFIEFGQKDACRAVYSRPGQFGLVRQAMHSNVGDAASTLKSNGFQLDNEIS